MANKRKLKRSINYICSDIFAESVAASLYSDKPNQDNIKALMSSVLNMHSDYIRRVSHPEPGMKPKVYYKNIISSFHKHVSEIIDQIANLQ